MQDKLPTGPVAMNDAAPPEGAELSPRDEAAIAATSSLVTGDGASTGGSGSQAAGRAIPGRGHKMEILDDTIAALDDATHESPLVQMVKGWIDRAAAVAHVAVDKTASSVIPLAQAAAAAKDTTFTKAQDYKASASVAKDQWIGDAKTAIQARPLTAVAIGALAGVAISLIFFSPSDYDES